MPLRRFQERTMPLRVELPTSKPPINSTMERQQRADGRKGLLITGNRAGMG